MDERLTTFLERIGEADQLLRSRGDDPEPFLLISAGGGEVLVHHPAWDRSWQVPTAQDIDDLEELGHLRTERSQNTKRVFFLTVAGRVQARLLIENRLSPSTGKGRAPGLDQVVRWLVELEQSQPEAFDFPPRLLDAAVTGGFIERDSREALAGRIIRLVSDGFLDGSLPDFDQASDEQRLGLSDGLHLTMNAHDHVQDTTSGAPGALNFYGLVVAGQIAAGDITNYVSFDQVLERAAREIDDLDDVSPETRSEAQSLIDVFRGRAVDLAGTTMTGAGGSLLAMVISQLVGLRST